MIKSDKVNMMCLYFHRFCEFPKDHLTGFPLGNFAQAKDLVFVIVYVCWTMSYVLLNGAIFNTKVHIMFVQRFTIPRSAHWSVKFNIERMLDCDTCILKKTFSVKNTIRKTCTIGVSFLEKDYNTSYKTRKKIKHIDYQR